MQRVTHKEEVNGLTVIVLLDPPHTITRIGVRRSSALKLSMSAENMGLVDFVFTAGEVATINAVCARAKLYADKVNAPPPPPPGTPIFIPPAAS
jgi:hypothetical protein